MVVEKIWDKINNYDLWGVMFPGIICNIAIGIIYKWGYIGSFSFDFLNNFGNTVAFISISYFVGIILQEMGNAIMNIIFFHKGEPSDIFLSKDSNLLNEEEKNLFVALVRKKYRDDFDPSKRIECRVVFNYINNYLSIKGMSEKCDKMQSLFGLSRGLFCAFFTCSIGVIIVLILNFERIILFNIVACLCVCLCASAFLYRRTIRYAKIRVKTVCQLYYISTREVKDE